MALKLNNDNVNTNIPEANMGPVTVQEDQEEGRKLFANKSANRALIIAGIIIAVLIVGAIVFVNIPIQ